MQLRSHFRRDDAFFKGTLATVDGNTRLERAVPGTRREPSPRSLITAYAAENTVVGPLATPRLHLTSNDITYKEHGGSIILSESGR